MEIIISPLASALRRFRFAPIVIFSGSIYLRIVLTYLGFEKLYLVNLITPFGGLMFILGWLMLFISIPPREAHEKAPKSDD